MNLKSYYAHKLIFIVGGSEGIGLSAAADAAALGAQVVILSRDPKKRAEALKRLETSRQEPNQILATAELDITDPEATAMALKALLQQYGTPDILVNAAGVAVPGYFQDLELPAFRQMMELNYFGSVHLIQAVLPAMMQARRGQIVNISSMAGYLGLYGYAGYCASKYAVIGFSQALRQELRPYGIGVSVLCPPSTRTPGFERENQTKPKEILELELRGGTAEADPVARAMWRALPRNPFLIHPTIKSGLIYHGARLFPGLAEVFTRR